MHAGQLQFKRAVFIVINHQAHACDLCGVECDPFQLITSIPGDEVTERDVDGGPCAVASFKISPVADLLATPARLSGQPPGIAAAIASDFQFDTRVI